MSSFFVYYFILIEHPRSSL